MVHLVDLPAPATKGTYIALVEPNVVKIGVSARITTRLYNLRTNTFRRIALLAWTNTPEKEVHFQFKKDRITLTREFFWISSELLIFINECRLSLGFLAIEEVQLWDFGGPLPWSRSVDSSQVNLEASKLGRYHTHVRWHRVPKASCEFCGPRAG